MSIETYDQIEAARLVGVLWPLARVSGGPRAPQSEKYRRFRGAIEPGWLQSLPLQIGQDRPAAQIVTLESPGNLQRPSTDKLAEEYSKSPRTRIYENAGRHTEDWITDLTMRLRMLAQCVVTCALYESSPDDANFGMHYDEWYLIALQLRGVKEWSIQGDTVDMTPGDVLCLPQRVRHGVHTPGPEDSVHMAIAVVTDQPLDRISYGSP